MKERMLAVLAATSLLLPACSGTTDNNVKLTSDDNGKVCKMEKITGSKIVHKVCRSPAQIEYDKQLAYNTMREAVKGSIRSR